MYCAKPATLCDRQKNEDNDMSRIISAKWTCNALIGVTAQRCPQFLIWKNFNALAVVGQGGSGKTMSSVYWLSQWAIQGVRFLICDPHAQNDESLNAYTQHLHGALVAPVVSQYQDTTRYIRQIHELGKRRIDNVERDHSPVVLVIDEFTSYVINSGDEGKKAIVQLLDSINQYRKVNIRALFIGQTWGAAVQKVSSLRDSISNALVLKSAENNAKKFCALPQQVKNARNLKPGQGYFGEEHIYIPRVNDKDRALVREYIEDHATHWKPILLDQETPQCKGKTYKNELLLEKMLTHDMAA